MSNVFLFIIPLTPLARMTARRSELQSLCFEVLVKQSYSNWKALLIGDLSNSPVDPRFIQISFEGHKEEKLQVATQFIQAENINCDYIIRLDDDDIFNPLLLEKLATKKFDLYLDKFQSFWEPMSGMVAQKVLYWFANTCIHAKVHALSQFGEFPLGDYQRLKSRPLLIENEHNDFHLYYVDKISVIYADARDPVYLRALNPDSITSAQSSEFNTYLRAHGFWRRNNFKSYQFLKLHTEVTKSVIKETIVHYIQHILENFKALRNYQKLVRTKHSGK